MSIASEQRRCPKCGGPIPPEAPQGLCPKCLLAEVSIPTEAGQTSKAVSPSRDELAAAFPHLEILELIGQGGMGFVFKARQPKLDRFVALKILSQSLAADPAFAERFTREGRVLARLSHPNIVAIHDFGQANGFFYLLMEFVDGVNLRQAMRAGRFTPDQALAIVPKICEALQYAHNEGILHRDIKPENILIDIKGRVKIADFGIAKLMGDVQSDAHLTGSGATLGTPHYMAPEQIERPASVDHRADIYSLGVVFYEMLTGELPLGRFAAPSEKSASDPRLDDVVFRTLEKEPGRRPQSAGEVKTQVETIASEPADDKTSARKITPGALSTPPKYSRTGTQKMEAPVSVASIASPWRARLFWLLVTVVSLPVLLVLAYFLLPIVFKQRVYSSFQGSPMARVSVIRAETRDNLVVVEIQCETAADKFEMHPRLAGPPLSSALQQRALTQRDFQVILPARLGERPFENYAWSAAGTSHRWRIAFALPDESLAKAAQLQIQQRAAASTVTLESGGTGSAIFEVSLPGAEPYRAWLEFEPMHRVVLAPASTEDIGTTDTNEERSVRAVKTVELTGATNEIRGDAKEIRVVQVKTDSLLRPGESITAKIRHPDWRFEESQTSFFIHRKANGMATSSHFTWFIPASFSVNQMENAVAQLRRNWTDRPISLTNERPLLMFAVTNDSGGVLHGYLDFRQTSPGPDLAQATVRVGAALPVNMLFFFKAYVPPGYSLQATAGGSEPRAGESHTSMSVSQHGTDYHCSWYPPQSFTSEGRQGADAQLQRLANRGSFVVSLGEPFRAFSITNKSGEVFEGFFELAGPNSMESGVKSSGSSAVTSKVADATAPTVNSMRALATRICDGDPSALDELRDTARQLYAGLDRTTEQDRIATNLFLMRAVFDVLGEQAGRSNAHAFAALQSSVFERHLKGAATRALGIAAAAGHEPSMDMLIHHREWNILLSSTVFALGDAAGKNNDRAIQFLSEVVTNKSHRALWYGASQGLRPAAAKGNAVAKAALEIHDRENPNPR